MIELKKIQGDNIPQSVEYLGMNEWAVRWDVKQFETQYETLTITGYEYYEIKFNEKPTYESFVSKIIRTKYTNDEEAALKSNMVEQLLNGTQPMTKYDEWQAFQELRNEAKSIGKQIFNVIN